MKKRYIIISSLLLIILVFIFFINKHKSKIITEEFKYALDFNINDTTDIFYYSDDYFRTSGEKINKHLLTLSLQSVLSLTPSYETDEVTNINSLLEKIGFEDTEYYDIYEDTSTDTIGNIISHKRIDYFDVILIDIRGFRYGDEWASNLLVGESDNHHGFEKANNKIINRLKDYIDKYDLSKIKIWVTGYSRAGAVANLMGVYLNEHLDDFDLKTDDIYIYTFEAPNSSSSNKTYKNIHNIINKNDITNFIPFNNWNLISNGISFDITQKKEINAKRLKVNIFDANADIIDIGNINFEEFIKEFVNYLSENIDRKLYKNNLEEPLYNFIKYFYNLNQNERNELQRMFSIFISRLKENTEFIDIIKNYILPLGNTDNNKLIKILTNTLKEVYDEENINISKENYMIIENLIEPIIKVFLPIIEKDFNNEKGMLYYLLTFSYNIDSIAKEHYGITNLNLVKKFDSYYNK